MAELNAEGWLDDFLMRSREDQLRIAAAAQRAFEDSERCWYHGHDDKASLLSTQRQNALKVCTEVIDSSDKLTPPGKAAVVRVAHRVSAALGATIWPA